jgi:hypothetical protein
MRRILSLMLLLTLVTALGACGSEQSSDSAGSASTKKEKPAPPPKPHVKIAVAGVRGVMSADLVESTPYGVRRHGTRIAGTVSPAGSVVKVNGRRAVVRGSHWRIDVKLKRGQNDYEVRAKRTGYVEADPFRLTLVRKRTPAELKAYRAEVARKRELARQRRLAAIAQRKQNFINSAQPIDYKELQKDADSHAGEKVKVYGQIFQIQQDGDFGGIMLVSVTNDGYGFWDDHVWVNYTGKVAKNEDDLITIYGKVKGSKSYDTQAGGTTYVPEVNAKYIDP